VKYVLVFLLLTRL